MSLSDVNKILIVDDEEAIRELLSDLLTTRYKNIHIIEAENYDSAIDGLKKHSIDLLLLDLNMPGKSGIEVLKTITQLDEETRPYATIIISGKVDEVSDFSTAMNIARLPKPFDNELFYQMVSEVIPESFEELDLEDDEGEQNSSDLSDTLNLFVNDAIDIVTDFEEDSGNTDLLQLFEGLVESIKLDEHHAQVDGLNEYLNAYSQIFNKSQNDQSEDVRRQALVSMQMMIDQMAQLSACLVDAETLSEQSKKLHSETKKAKQIISQLAD